MQFLANPTPLGLIATEKQDPHGKFKRVKKVMLHKFKDWIKTKKVGLLKTWSSGSESLSLRRSKGLMEERVMGSESFSSSSSSSITCCGRWCCSFRTFFINRADIVFVVRTELLSQRCRGIQGNSGVFRGAQKAKIDYCSLKFNRKRTHSNEWKNEESSVGVTQFISFCHSWVSLTFTSAQEKEVGSQFKVAQFIFSGPYGLPTSVAHVYGEMGSICVTRTEEPTKHKMSHTNSSNKWLKVKAWLRWSNWIL